MYLTRQSERNKLVVVVVSRAIFTHGRMTDDKHYQKISLDFTDSSTVEFSVNLCG